MYFQTRQDGKPVQLEYWEGCHRSKDQAILYSMVVLGKSELRSETLSLNFPTNQANNNSKVSRFKELGLQCLIYQFRLYLFPKYLLYFLSKAKIVSKI